MAYADYSFYADEYVGDAVTETEWPLYSARASRLVDMLTRYQVQKQGLDSFPAFVQAQVKLAVCAQADYFAYMGIDHRPRRHRLHGGQCLGALRQ